MLSAQIFHFICLVLVSGQSSDPESREPTLKALNFASMLSGKFSNAKQVKAESAFIEEEEPRDSLIFKVTPVEVAALQPTLTFIVNEIVNGNLTRYHLLTIFEDDEGFVNLKHYIIPSNLTASKIQNLRRDDIKQEVGCDAKYTKLTDTTFIGSWPACTQFRVNVKQRYSVTVTCSSFTMTVLPTQNLPESGNEIPYVNYKIETYPLPASVLARAGQFKPSCSN
ncbi:uncharacterized protein LOC106063633 [Biomphalaria glabrata]|uniref:Uncharacterized protein LOC106063633 n=1 Tax=Biomphalaria glabrata TaxID=6526 RepID=A0A9W3BFS0_BIOGL|nr:uncharacterized protein LOC106063633 [Biomphalaria glabrata]